MNLRLATLLALSLSGASLFALEPKTPQPAADRYYLVFLRPRPERKDLDMPERQRIQSDHMANIRKMADEDVLAAAGPFDDKPATISGIFVLKTKSMDDARTMALRDPTVVEGLNTMDIHLWMGPPGVGSKYFEWEKKHPGYTAEMEYHVFCILAPGPRGRNDMESLEEVKGLIENLRSENALAAAGAIQGDPDMVGLLIFKSSDKEEARRRIEQDPFVLGGRLKVEYHIWWSANRVLPWE